MSAKNATLEIQRPAPSGIGRTPDRPSMNVAVTERLISTHQAGLRRKRRSGLQATVSHVLPDTVTAEMHRKEAEPGSADK